MTVTARKEWRGWLQRCAGFGDEPDDKERAVWKEAFKDLSKEDKALVKEIHEQVAREREIANGIDQPDDSTSGVETASDKRAQIDPGESWFNSVLANQRRMIELLEDVRTLLASLAESKK